MILAIVFVSLLPMIISALRLWLSSRSARRKDALTAGTPSTEA